MNSLHFRSSSPLSVLDSRPGVGSGCHRNVRIPGVPPDMGSKVWSAGGWVAITADLEKKGADFLNLLYRHSGSLVYLQYAQWSTKLVHALRQEFTQFAYSITLRSWFSCRLD